MLNTSHLTPFLPLVTRRVKVSVALLLALTACKPDDPDPCTVDAFGCVSNFETLPTDPSCTTIEPLAISLGWGDSSFHTFQEGTPEVYNGIQGGQHFFASFRASGAELDDVPMVELRLFSFGPVDPQACTDEVLSRRTYDPASLPADALTGDFDPAPTGSPIILGYMPLDLPELPPFGPSRCLSLGSERQLLVDATPEQAQSGLLETDSILLQLPFSSSPQVLVAATLRDACGETTYAYAELNLPR
jgi:hypothetical protein